VQIFYKTGESAVSVNRVFRKSTNWTYGHWRKGM